MKIGILKETKIPSDSRVPLTPSQCKLLLDKGVNLVVQKSDVRIFKDEEYASLGVPLVDSVDDCTVLLGVKEVKIEELIPYKTYFFFSHTIKAQPYNRGLLKHIIKNNIRLIDWETLTDSHGRRLIAFGKFAGIVGAYNGILGYGILSGKYSLKRLSEFKDFDEAKKQFDQLNLPNIKIVITGNGRVANGAALVMDEMKIRRISPQEYLENTYEEPVFTQLKNEDYVEHNTGKAFDLQEFFTKPQDFKSIFKPYTKVSNLMINGIYWDNAAPAFFTREDMIRDCFNLELIADITCDIAPVASIPSTVKASTITNPFFAYDPKTNKEIEAFRGQGITMMTVDNLPNELPRDASQSFGKQFLINIWPALKEGLNSKIISEATITADGHLTQKYRYLTDYVS